MNAPKQRLDALCDYAVRRVMASETVKRFELPEFRKIAMEAVMTAHFREALTKLRDTTYSLGYRAGEKRQERHKEEHQ